MAKEIKARFAQKIDSAENWLKATGFTPYEGELLIVSDYNNLIVTGDGESSAAALVSAAIIDLPVHDSKIGAIPEDKTVYEFVEDEALAVYNKSVIALSVDGTTVTYVTGDGKSHTFQTQDTNTTYSLGTDSETGLTKLYATTGSAEDGTMTQKAISDELSKKVGVTIENGSVLKFFN